MFEIFFCNSSFRDIADIKSVCSSMPFSIPSCIELRADLRQKFPFGEIRFAISMFELSLTKKRFRASTLNELRASQEYCIDDDRYRFGVGYQNFECILIVVSTFVQFRESF
jgi:hypothetical protein